MVLRENDFLVDVGCGYGRLAEVLQVDHTGEYLGTDVVPELLNFAKANFNRQDWNFELVDQQKIPAEDESVDMVCFSQSLLICSTSNPLFISRKLREF